MEIRAYPYDVCDFCSSDKPAWEYPAADCIVSPPGDPLPQKSIGSWLACDQCAALIQRNEWNKLTQRALENVPGGKQLIAIAGKEAALAQTARGLKTFRAHRSGKVKPYEAHHSR